MEGPEVFVIGNKDLNREILLHASYEDIVNYCKVNHAAKAVCDNGDFWREKAWLMYGVPNYTFNLSDLSPHERFLEIYTQEGNVAPGSSKYLDFNTFAKQALVHDREDLISKHRINYLELTQEALIEYGRRGDFQKIIKYLAGGLGVEFAQYPASGAVEVGNMELFERIDSFYRIKSIDGVYLVIGGAISSGRRDIIDVVIPQMRTRLRVID